MNEDYVGRMFARNRRMKFSTFLLEQRIYLAQRMIQFDPEIKISRLADMVGYSLDGQYFSRAFRKVTGKTPTQYRKLAGGEEG
jgi:two-component system response regulator YesN